MLCITGKENNFESLSSRINRFSHALVQEIRLDYQKNPLSVLDKLLKNNSPELARRWIVTCRPVSQGGFFEGSEKERISILKKAVRGNVGFVDIEWCANNLNDHDNPQRNDNNHQKTLFSNKQSGQKIILSHHVFTSDWKTEEIIRILEDMMSSSADILKMALMVDDVATFAELKFLAERFQKKPLVLVSMGKAGLIGRVFYHFFKSPWTYVAAVKSKKDGPPTLTEAAVPAGATAPGQVLSSEMASLGLHPKLEEQTKKNLLVLFGGAQVVHSPGPPTYNNFFRAKGLPFVYLPAPTNNLEKAVSALSTMGLVGAAVTMPHKDDASRICTKLHGPARKLHSINTLVLRGKSWEGYSTDGHGVYCAISQHLQSVSTAKEKKVCVSVLGAGGAARAAALAMKDKGAEVTLFARRPKKAHCENLGLMVEKWELRQKKAWDVLINATPIGSRSGEGAVSPFSFCDSESLSDKVVLDMNYRPPCTALLKAAAQLGAKTVTGLEMWVHQGIPQLELWTGAHIDSKALLAFIPTVNFEALHPG